ncbi:MAG TPA: hypothetical protein PLS90_15035, partial [Candidatus Sumerlaeota bacterium]|nr:hypothetical protein [Candidatus Sumerlaeota bacterium]
GEDGNFRLGVRNTGDVPAFLAEVHVGARALASFIPSDNYFWLPAGEEKWITLEKSPAASLALDPAAVTVRAWNAAPAPCQPPPGR